LFKQKTILAQGEILSTTLFQHYLTEYKIESVLLSALNFMRIDENGEPKRAYIEEMLSKELSQVMSSQYSLRELVTAVYSKTQ
tara:strand:- start:17697 stop:17945 length:249 start_codon:yes stop_codon:yes gene_type:complete